MSNFKQRFIGDKAFYKMILLIAFPILIQNGITNFVSLLDNIMVGQLGTEQMSGVAIVNQLINVFNICIFGAVSGASIFSAQFFGQGNHEGVRNTFRFKLVCCVLITGIWIAIFLAGGSELMMLFLHDTGSGDVAMTHDAGMNYLYVMLIGLLPYTFTQIYASTLRETGETILPMIAGIIAVLVNLCFNYLLIFGNFGFPNWGIVGAAVATVLSRFCEMGIVIVWTHMNREQNIFIQGVYRHFKIPGNLVGQIIRKGMPLLANETLWSAGQAVFSAMLFSAGLKCSGGIKYFHNGFKPFQCGVYCVRQRHFHRGGAAARRRRAGKGGGHRPEDDILFRDELFCGRSRTVFGGSGVSEDLQYLGGSAPSGGKSDPNSIDVYAPVCLLPCILFYPADRGEDGHYLFV